MVAPACCSLHAEIAPAWSSIVAMALGAQLLAILSGNHDRTQVALDRLTSSRGLLRGLGADDSR